MGNCISHSDTNMLPHEISRTQTATPKRGAPERITVGLGGLNLQLFHFCCIRCIYVIILSAPSNRSQFADPSLLTQDSRNLLHSRDLNFDPHQSHQWCHLGPPRGPGAEAKEKLDPLACPKGDGDPVTRDPGPSHHASHPIQTGGGFPRPEGIPRPSLLLRSFCGPAPCF